MRLATLRDGTRDGRLLVVTRDGERAADARAIAPTLQAALDDWGQAAPRLAALAEDAERGKTPVLPLDPTHLAAPLPRAYEWIDGSAFLSHVELVRRARGAALPPSLRTDPLVYQGGSGVLLGPRDPMRLGDPDWGLDMEGEVAVVLTDTPRGTRHSEAAAHVALILLANDVTYRGLVPTELEKGFGFFCSKPSTAFSPLAATPDELGPAWLSGRVHLRLRTLVNGALVGDPDASAMHFSFEDLVEHVTRTRALTAGTILGSGTVSNEDPSRGVSCLAERRMRELLEGGQAITPFLRAGDHIQMEMLDPDGRSVFGSIQQEVIR